MKKLMITFAALFFIVSIGYAEQEGRHVDLNGVDVIVYYPDLSITPGVADPSVKQSKIKTTICVTGYTKDRSDPQEFLIC